jgi:hypothetical protein
MIASAFFLIVFAAHGLKLADNKPKHKHGHFPTKAAAPGLPAPGPAVQKPAIAKPAVPGSVVPGQVHPVPRKSVLFFR